MVDDDGAVKEVMAMIDELWDGCAKVGVWCKFAG
jgi:hypothetical protein